MSDSVAALQHKLSSAHDLQSVVRTMKAMAAANINQYENAVRSLDDYYRTVELGLSAYFRYQGINSVSPETKYRKNLPIGVVVFGSDQGLVGQFNDAIVDFAVTQLSSFAEEKKVWAVGERIGAHLSETKLAHAGEFILPSSIVGVTSLVGQILSKLESARENNEIDQVYLFFHRPESGATYRPAFQRLLPLDQLWQKNLSLIKWPTKNIAEVLNKKNESLLAFVREYLFVSLFRACAESLASENASRLKAMQRAEKNIDELLDELHRTYHQLRQSGIDEELFDVISGFEALKSQP